MTKRKAGIIFICLSLAVGVVYVSPAGAQDAQTVERLERLIKEQQRQLESLQQQLNQLKQTADDAQTQAQEAKSAAEEAKTTAQAPVEKVVTSGNERVKLAVSGQVHRAVNIIDDGKNTTAYYIDSDASNSRVRFVGTAKVTDDLTFGARLEIAFAPNESSEVSQNNESPDDFLDERWADVTFDSKRFGKLWFGKGDTASNNTSEVDLSGTDLIAYSSVGDPAGGMFFRESRGNNSLTDVTIFDVYNNFDGLSRRSRVRYDTPDFWGFNLAGSVVDNQRWDAALKWGGQGYGFKAAAAGAVADPNQDNIDLQYNGSFSILHEGTGLNLTAYGGFKDRDGGENDPSSWYIKGGWLTQLFSFGQTAFGLDYFRSTNLPTNSDDAYSVGAAVVQQIDQFATEFYLQYRFYSLDRDVAPATETMNVGTIGARIKF